MKKFLATFLSAIWLLTQVAQAEFIVNELQGFGAGAAVPSVCTYDGSVVDATNLTTYAPTGVAIGTAAADRFVIVGIAGRAAAARTISSATIGGAGATLIMNTSSQNFSGFIGLTVTTGTTATISVTMSAGMNQLQMHVWDCTGLDSTTPESTLYSAANDPTGTLAVSADAHVIAHAMCDGTGKTDTWTGVSEDFDAVTESAFSAGHLKQVSADASYTVTSDWSACTAASMSVISLK